VVRRWLPWLVLGVLVIGAVTWAAWPGGSQTRAERAHALATELKCPDCEGLSVADSNTSTARAIRADIGKRIARGQSDGDIRRAYVDLYGESILLSPSGSGLGFLVWGLPVAALVLGAGGLVVALRRWQRQPRLRATDADVALVEGVRDRGAP
jgi:cytochrome c-type biogenesis protein CcmH